MSMNEAQAIAQETQMMKKCPCCGESISINALRCKHCNESLVANLPKIKQIPTFLFLVLSLITFNVFPLVWIILNRKNFNSLVQDKPKKIGIASVFFITLFTVLGILLEVMMSAKGAETKSSGNSFLTVCWFIQIFVTMNVLKQIELFATECYKTKIKHNGLVASLFTFIYLSFAVNSFKDRVSNKK